MTVDDLIVELSNLVMQGKGHLDVYAMRYDADYQDIVTQVRLVGDFDGEKEIEWVEVKTDD